MKIVDLNGGGIIGLWFVALGMPDKRISEALICAAITGSIAFMKLFAAELKLKS